MSEAIAVVSAPTLVEMVRALAQARMLWAESRGTIASARSFFEATIAEEVDVEHRRAEVVATLEREVKALAQSHFLATGEKKPCDGVSIKEFEIFQYDADDAYAWAKIAGVAIIPEALDRKAFEKIAKAASLPFVVSIMEPRAQIATDLSSLVETSR